MITIIYAHPLENGMNASVRDALTEHLQEKKISYSLIELYKDKFNPVLSRDERETFFSTKGVSTDPLVKKYQDILKITDHIVFIFPIWWYDQPAILKGFFERVCLPGFGYAYTEHGTEPLLNTIRHATVLTTSGDSTERLEKHFGNIIEAQFIKNIIYNISHTNDTKWINFEHASVEGLDNYITKVKERF